LLGQKNPLINRLDSLDENISTHFIFGLHTWMSKSAGVETSKKMNGYVTVDYISNAGHHVYIDNYQEFNQLIYHYLVEKNDDYIWNESNEE